MENYIENIFGNKMAKSMERMLLAFKEENKTPEQIAESLKDLHEIVRNGIYVCALNNGDKKTADKIAKANQILKERRINEFKEAVSAGKKLEFLGTLSVIEQISLKVDMELLSVDSHSDKPLTDEEKKYLNIIIKSVNDNIKKIALSLGFSSIEEFREYNAKMVSALESDFTRIGLWNQGLKEYKENNCEHIL